LSKLKALGYNLNCENFHPLKKAQSTDRKISIPLFRAPAHRHFGIEVAE
jgi:hypothetical protein